MKRRNLRVAVLVLCAILMQTGAFAAEADPVAVRVGTVEYPLSEVQSYWTTIYTQLMTMGAEFTEADIEKYEQDVMDSFVFDGILENKYMEFGIDEILFADQTEIETRTDEIFNDVLEMYAEQIMEQYGATEEKARKYAPDFVDLDGYSRDLAREQAEEEFKEERLIESLTEDLEEPTEEELRAYYDANYVQPTMKLAEDFESFETSVLPTQLECYYYPEDYRYVRHIYLKASQETLDRIEELETAYGKSLEELETADRRLSDADDAQAQAEYDRVAEELNALTEEMERLRIQSGEDNAALIQEIEKKIEDGADFEELIAEYNQDEDQQACGYPVCAKSVIWDEYFQNAAMSLEKIGDISEAVCTPGGVHFICWVSEAKAGARPLEGELMEEVRETAIREKKFSVLNDFVEEWKKDYDIFTDQSLLMTPEIAE